MNLKFFFAMFLALLAASCGRERTPQAVAEQVVAAFLDCRFTEVEGQVAPEVAEMMRWRASQMTQADVELLAEQETPVQVEAEETLEGPDSCIVMLRGTDALLMDSIGQPAHIGETHYRAVLKKDNGRNWIVTALAEVL